MAEGIYKLRSWSQRGNTYHSLGVPREIAERIPGGALFVCEMKSDGTLVYTQIKKG